MPNGGEHFETIAECPHCRSMRIHKRKGWHLIARWRCRKCHKTFIAPRWKDWVYPHGTEPPRWSICKE